MPRPRHRARARALQEASHPSGADPPQVIGSLSMTLRTGPTYPFAVLPEHNPYTFAQYLARF